MIGSMANDNMPERLPGDELPPFPAAAVPTEPAKLDTWREEYVRDLMDHHLGGIDAPWRN